MKHILIALLALFFSGIAYSDTDQQCSKALIGKTSCISGDKMECTEIFDLKSKSQILVWRPVNTSGQTFSPDIPMYKKVPGFTPAKCGN